MNIEVSGIYKTEITGFRLELKEGEFAILCFQQGIERYSR